jgi:CRISPR-associated endoribonuclease Cas6
VLIRSTWTLKPDQTISLPKAYGLDLSKSLHKQLSLELGSESVPSTTFSGIIGGASTSKDFITFNADEFYQLSLSGLQETSAKAIADLDLGDQLNFLGASFNIINRDDETTSYEALYHTYVADEPEPTRQFDLSFLTPAAFSQNRLYLPLPVPTLIFQSWLERWNHFAPVYLGGEDLIGYLGEAVALQRHRISTRSFQVHNSHISGFTGNVTLKVISRTDPLLANVAHLLVQYAVFAGTGVKTRLGMGTTHLNQAKH